MHVDDAAAFGHYLQATRERQRITLELVSHRTKIAPRLLAALERGDVGAWPPGIYRRAMIRAYAEAVGVDREFALEQFSRLFERPPEAAVPAPPPSSRRNATSWVVQAAQLAGAATVVAIVVAALAYIVRRVPQDAGPVVHAQTAPVQPAPAARAVVPIPAPPLTPAAPAGEEPLEGRLTIESKPAGAVVMVNGIRRGLTPLTIGDVPAGAKRVRLILDGYVSEERVAVVSAEQPAAAIQVTLANRH